MNTASIKSGVAPAASARHARGSHACPCAEAPWAAWASAKRTGRTPFFEVMNNSSHSDCSPCPFRAHEKVERAVRAVRFQPSYASHGVVAHGRGCVGVQAARCATSGPTCVPRRRDGRRNPVRASVPAWTSFGQLRPDRHRLHPVAPATGGATYFPTLPAATCSSPQHHTRSKKQCLKTN